MMRFSVLASGSAGNASLIECNRFGLLIDAGLGPRLMASRLSAIGASWKSVSAVLLSHTHSDHWKDRTLSIFAKLRIPVFCHAEHGRVLRVCSAGFHSLAKANLVRDYDGSCDLMLGSHLRCRPLELSHDSEPTFGFRIEGTGGLLGPMWSLGYLSDLGCWSNHLVEAVAGVDVLALEFNHDERMERESSRPPVLIERVLSDHGHLSNAQAAGFLRRVLDCTGAVAPEHLVQLHLSRECNRPNLAQAAARQLLEELKLPLQLHTASQHQVGPILTLGSQRPGERRPKRSASRRRAAAVHPSLPGMD